MIKQIYENKYRQFDYIKLFYLSREIQQDYN